MARYSCLVIGSLLALLFLLGLITCRITGLPVAELPQLSNQPQVPVTAPGLNPAER